MERNDPTVTIGGSKLGSSYPALIVAEVSANHAGSIDRAVSIIESAAESGADAVKLQTYTADTLTIDCDRAPFLIQEGLWKGHTLYDLYEEAHTPWEWHETLFRTAKENGLMYFSTPFDPTAVEFLEKFAPPCYKLASFEILDLELIECLAKTGRPLIASTGMSNLREIEDAVTAFRNSGGRDLVFLVCISSYPADPADFQLRRLADLLERFDLPVGLSDHSPGHVTPVAARTFGACVIEKHLTLDRADGGPDAGFSMEPHEFAQMVRAVRDTESAMGPVEWGPGTAERGSLVFRRSLFVVESMNPGDTFNRSNTRVIRPGHGLSPKHYPEVLGKKSRHGIERGTPLTWDLIRDV